MDILITELVVCYNFELKGNLTDSTESGDTGKVSDMYTLVDSL